MTKIKVAGTYPFSFETSIKLPKFKYEVKGCTRRQKLLVEQMTKQDIPSPYHAYVEYVIEQVEIKDGTEYWHLGS